MSVNMSMDEDEVRASIKKMKASAENIQSATRIYKETVETEYKRSNLAYVGKVLDIAESMAESGNQEVNILDETEVATEKFIDIINEHANQEIGGIE